MVPVAHGSDGGGSIRIPAAACGLVGIKPGEGVIPGVPGRSGWNGLSSDGPLATTVDDLALLLAVMADRPDLRDVDVPARSLRVAVSVKSPMSANAIDPAFAAAAEATAELLAGAGHDVTPADPPYEQMTLFAMGMRALAGMAEDASAMNRSLLERRSKPSVRIGSAVRRLGLVRDVDRDRWRTRARQFFDGFDVLVTPTLAATPITAEGWSRRSWTANSQRGVVRALHRCLEPGRVPRGRGPGRHPPRRDAAVGAGGRTRGWRGARAVRRQAARNSAAVAASRTARDDPDLIAGLTSRFRRRRRGDAGVVRPEAHGQIGSTACRFGGTSSLRRPSFTRSTAAIFCRVVAGSITSSTPNPDAARSGVVRR